MKRLLACLMLVILLAACVASLFPMTAVATSKEEYDWLRVYYAMKTEEGVAEERVALSGGAEIVGGCVLYFDDTKARAILDDHQISTGHVLSMAGEYELKIYNLADDTAMLEYNFKVLPDINVSDGQVFTEFPQINFTNAYRVTYADFAEPTPIAAGERIQNFGRFTVYAYGKNKNDNEIEFKYTIYVKMVHAVQVQDPEKGHALNVIVGTFEGHTVEATLDDSRALQSGDNLVTEVGTHTLAVKLDGVYQPSTSLALPDSEALSLRIPIHFASKEQRSPYYFDFTGWDATVKLDGKTVSGEVRMAKHGKHTLEAFDKDGNRIENAFAITEGQNLTVVPTTQVQFRYINLHFFFAIGAGVVALGFAVFALVLFLARRRMI